MIVVPKCPWSRQYDVCAQLSADGLLHATDSFQGVCHQAVYIVPNDMDSIELERFLHLSRMLNIRQVTEFAQEVIGMQQRKLEPGQQLAI